jgi:hypothetical protein
MTDSLSYPRILGSTASWLNVVLDISSYRKSRAAGLDTPVEVRTTQIRQENRAIGRLEVSREQSHVATFL